MNKLEIRLTGCRFRSENVSRTELSISPDHFALRNDIPGSMSVTEDDDAQSATVTVEDRFRDIFEGTAAFNHDNRQGLGKIEKMVIRAAIKAMNEHLSKDAA